MDDPALGVADHRAALRGLRRLNALSGAGGAFYRELRGLAAGGRPLRVLDLATGGGDIPINLCRKAARAGWDLRVDGCDLSPVALEYAQGQARKAGVAVKFFRLDALKDPIPTGYDVVISSLFFHHLRQEQVVALLSKLAGAVGRRIIINDLLRSRSSLGLVYLGTRLVTRCKVVHRDGPQSVRAAFTVRQFADLCDRAGLVDAKIRRSFPCRFVMTWDKKDFTQRR